MKLIFDTSILIDHLRGGEVFKKVKSTFPEDFQLFLPTLAVAELFSGKSTRNKNIEKRIEVLLSNFEIINFDRNIAKKAGILFRDSNISIELADYIVAATAIEIGAQVVTLNKKHFSQIPQVVIYPL